MLVRFDTDNVRLAAVPDLEGVPVEDAVELRLLREVFVDQLQESATNVCSDVHAARRV